MSERDEELELQALQRELDDAFTTTRPRVGFEDELWSRMQSRRPFGARMREAFAGLVQGIREVPAVPLASVAAVLVVAVGIGIFAFSGIGRGGNAASSAGKALSLNAGSPGNPMSAVGSFGRLPSPALGASPGVPSFTGGAASGAAPAAPDFPGPVTLIWAGQLNTTISSAPVFRYAEPTTNTADQFASSLGAALERRPAGFLGLYTASDYTLTVRGTVQSPTLSPAYFILSAPSMGEIAAAGAQPADIAALFLSEHSLAPQWPYTSVVEGTGALLKVHFQRQFDAPGYGLAYLVDLSGNRLGLEVDLSGNRPVLASGPLPVSIDSAPYPIIPADQALQLAVKPSAAANPVAPATTVQLTTAELVYTLVAAGDHSFYEPEYLFSGTFLVNGVTYEKRVLVPAVDPSQRR